MLYVVRCFWCMCMYHTSGIKFCNLVRSEFRGSIFSCEFIFMDTLLLCSRSEIYFQLRNYTRNFTQKWGFLLLPLGMHHGHMGGPLGTEHWRIVGLREGVCCMLVSRSHPFSMLLLLPLGMHHGHMGGPL